MDIHLVARLAGRTGAEVWVLHDTGRAQRPLLQPQRVRETADNDRDACCMLKQDNQKHLALISTTLLIKAEVVRCGAMETHSRVHRDRLIQTRSNNPIQQLAHPHPSTLANIKRHLPTLLVPLSELHWTADAVNVSQSQRA